MLLSRGRVRQRLLRGWLLLRRFLLQSPVRLLRQPLLLPGEPKAMWESVLCEQRSVQAQAELQVQEEGEEVRRNSLLRGRRVHQRHMRGTR
jgi:hypothetical protein